MKRILYALFFFTVFPAAAQEGTQQLSLSDCYTLARQNTPLASAQKLISEGTDAGLNAIQTNRYPQINFSARATYQSESITIPELVPGMPTINLSKDQYKSVLDIQQIIYDGGVIHANEALLIARSSTQLAQIEVQLDAIRQQVNEAVLSKLLMKKQLEVLALMSGDLSEQIAQLNQAVENGVALPADEQKVRVALLKVKQQQLEAQAGFDAAALTLNHLLGLREEQMILVNPEMPVIPEQSGYENRAEMDVFSKQISALDANIALNKSQRRPKLAAAVQGGYGRPGLNMLDDSFQPWYFAGITLSWQPWDWKKTQFQNQNLEIRKRLVLNQQETFEYNLENAKIALLTHMDALNKTLSLDDTVLDLQEDILKSESKKLDMGLSTGTDYVSAMNDRKEALLLKETHEIQLLKTKLDYLNLLGLPEIKKDENE